MTNKPELYREGSLWPGLAALALFVVLAATFLTARMPLPAGFGGDASITASIGYAMFNIDAASAVASEGFLVTFEIIDVVLVAALVGAVMLARREVGGEIVAIGADATDDDPDAAAPETATAATDGGPGADTATGGAEE